MRNQLINRLSINDIYSLCLQTQGKENNCLKEELYQLTPDENNRVAFNALWALSHFDEANNPWLFQKHDDLIDRVLVEKNETKRRLMLSLLLRQPFEEESLRSDFIDFCIAKITACSQPYAIRCYCMKLAYEQMKYYPELLEELRMAVDGSSRVHLRRWGAVCAELWTHAQKCCSHRLPHMPSDARTQRRHWNQVGTAQAAALVTRDHPGPLQSSRVTGRN